VGSHGEEAGASMCVMLEDGRSVEAFAAAGMGTSTDVLVRLVVIEEVGCCWM
jgi:hypothetical protein